MTTPIRQPYAEWERERWERIKVETHDLWERIRQLRVDYQARNWFPPRYVILSTADAQLLANAYSLIMPSTICGLPIRQTAAFVSLSTTYVGGKPHESSLREQSAGTAPVT